MSASLIGRLRSSTFRLSATAVSMSLTDSCFSSESALGPFHHGIRGRAGQSLPRFYLRVAPAARASGTDVMVVKPFAERRMCGDLGITDAKVGVRIVRVVRASELGAASPPAVPFFALAPSRTLWMFAPPFRPPDLVRRAGGLHDDPLIGGSERSSLEAGQRGFDEPRFEDDPYGLAVGIKFPGHPQR